MAGRYPADSLENTEIMGLLDKIKAKEAGIVVMGLGYVGLPLCVSFSKIGFHVTGFDIDPQRLADLKKAGYGFHLTTEPSTIKDADCIIICVPTPLNRYREPDMSYIVEASETILQNIRRGQLIVLESTTYPGTTEEVVLPILQRSGLKAGKGFYLAYSPERQDPNNKDFTLEKIPKIVSGYSHTCLRLVKALYDQIVESTVPVSSLRVAESAKLLENIYRAVNIALVNELKMLFDRMGIDIWEVIDSAKTKPFGFQAFYPGVGVGGHCIPVDPFYLTWKAREYDFSTKFIELAGEINTNMPYYVLSKIVTALNNHGKAIVGSRVLVLGVAYKRDIDDTRGSPSLKLIDMLIKSGAVVDYNDPFVPKLTFLDKESVTLKETVLRQYDCVVVAVDHTEYKPDFIARHSRLVVDTRNLIKKTYRHIIKA